MLFSLQQVHKISAYFELWCEHHQHIISLAESLGTVSAVIVALANSYASKKAMEPRLKSRLNIKIIVYPGTKNSNPPKYLNLSITNSGRVPVTIAYPNFTWKLVGDKGSWLVQSLDYYGDDYIPKRTYPVTILPGRAEEFFLSPESRAIEALQKIFQKKKNSWLHLRKMTAVFFSEDGHKFTPVWSNDVIELVKNAKMASCDKTNET